ncbi:hypothetical protein C7974DRAFT_226782 [Boeremia exigua]|uniref:uncharacterized protein n=1 Tax=Boeremia exigua TaxID=749465 RepID=UPI001E8D6FF9|nr:uncharacterized protein C7974DRAFT_226782 [Boeremia exigua]KAH6620131.1 hypothetical protein C7974DRAFT_226782 [Boeremia exigua]
MNTMEYSKDTPATNTSMPSHSYGKANEYVQHTQVHPEPNAGFLPPSHRGYAAKLGPWNIFVLAVGAIASFLAMAFLALLWAGAESARNGERTPSLWFFIVDNGWATRVVTVASVLIRLATAAQMGVFAALIAAWVLETTGASAEHLPMLSIIRTVNNGPQSHIWNVFHSLRVGSRYIYSTIVVVAILDALALQFTSTLLITDFKDTAIVAGNALSTFSGNEYSTIYYTAHEQYDDEAGSIQAGNGVDFFQAGPAAYARFAEWAEEPQMGADYADTGATLRAFLPFGSSDTRSALRGYDGPATVVDARVRCVLPSIEIHNITFMYESGSNSNYEIAIAGKVTTQGSITGMIQGGDDGERTGIEGFFLISVVARIYWINATDWRLSYTMLPAFTDISGFSNNVLEPDNTSFAPLLLMNATGDGWQAVLDEVVNQQIETSSTFIVGPYEWSQTPAGVWTDLKPSFSNSSSNFSSTFSSNSSSTLDIGLSATLCFANLNANNYAIHADDGADFAEPNNMTWIADTKTYDTSAVRRMLDTSTKDLTPKQRGILTLHAPADGNWTTQKLDDDSDYITTPIVTGLRKLNNPASYSPDSAYLGPNWGASAAFTPFSTYNGVHKTHAALFQDVMKTTRNPALAFQAFFTIVMQMTYYDLLPQFDIASNATYAKSERVEVPAQWIGFGVVMGLLVLHAVLICTAVALFLAKTDHSLLGNAWQAVAQVSSSDTLETMHCASNMTDLEVKRLLRMGSFEENDVVLRTGAEGGRSQAVYRRGTGEVY